VPWPPVGRSLGVVERADHAAPGTEWDGHVLLLHGTEDTRLAALAAWVRRGLDLGEKILYPEDPLHAADSLVAALEAHGVDATAATRDGRLAVLPLAEFYRPEGRVSVVDRALAEGFQSVRMSAEARAALTVLSPAAHLGFERRMEELTRIRPVSAMCQYPQATTTGARLSEVVAVHPTGVRQSTLTAGQDGHGLILWGEIDPTNTDVFAAVLTAAGHCASRVLCVDLAEVSYIDAGSCWRLDDATRRLRSAGGQVVLVAPQPTVERTLRLLEIDQLPGMAVVAGEP
jgi:anti-anti-sigma factor